jgi:hypothetical protein
MAIFVVTDPEGNWDNIRGVYEASSKEEVKKYLLKQEGFTLETEPEEWEWNNEIFEKEVIKIN